MNARQLLSPLALCVSLAACSDASTPVGPSTGPSASIGYTYPVGPNLPDYGIKKCDVVSNAPDLIVTAIAKNPHEYPGSFGALWLPVTVTVKNQGICGTGKFPLHGFVRSSDGIELIQEFQADDSPSIGADGWTKIGLAGGASMTVTGRIYVSSLFLSRPYAYASVIADSCKNIDWLPAATCAVTETNEGNNRSSLVLMWFWD